MLKLFKIIYRKRTLELKCHLECSQAGSSYFILISSSVHQQRWNNHSTGVQGRNKHSEVSKKMFGLKILTIRVITN